MKVHTFNMCFLTALQVIRNIYHSEFLGSRLCCCSCYPGFKTQPKVLNSFGVRFAYQPKSKLKRKAAEVPGYRVGVTKAWDSWHTGMLYILKYIS